MADEIKEHWNWGKFFSGFFDGKNVAKSLVFGIWFLIILFLITAVHGFISSKLSKPQTPTQSVGSNQGIIATKNEDKQGNSYSLLNLFNWR